MSGPGNTTAARNNASYLAAEEVVVSDDAEGENRRVPM